MAKEEFLKNIHEYGLNALKEFVRVCEENNLCYYVIGGTLLGAVRHKGFIPWDDDIDVAMPRSDYDRLLQLFDKFHKPYVLEFYQRNPDFLSYFAKIRDERVDLIEEVVDSHKDKKLGYLVDILPIDKTPNGKIARKFYFMHVLRLRFWCGTANVKFGIRTSRPKWEQRLLKVLRFFRIYRFVDRRKIYGKMDRLFHKVENMKSSKNDKYSGTITGAYKTREIVPSRLFGTRDEKVYLEFETLKVRVPVLYDEYLKSIYGNYMKLPDAEQQKSHYSAMEVKANGKSSEAGSNDVITEPSDK